MGRLFGPKANIVSGEGFFQGSQTVTGWTTLVTGFESNTNAYRRIAFLNGNWVISANNAAQTTHVVFVSSDGGVTWVSNPVVTTGTAFRTEGAAFGASTYVYVIDRAAGGLPLSFTSPDLVTWTQNATGFAAGALLSTPVFGNGVFVLVQNGGTDYATSPDGVTWTHHSTYVPTSWGGIVIFDGTRFLALVSGVSATNKLAVSTDGITWTESSVTFSALSSPDAVTNKAQSQYVVGDASTDNGDSANGALTVLTAVSFNDSGHKTAWLQFGGTKWTRANGSTNNLQSSPDGLTWSQDTVPAAGHSYSCIGFGGGKFIAIGSGASTTNFTVTRT